VQVQPAALRGADGSRGEKAVGDQSVGALLEHGQEPPACAVVADREDLAAVAVHALLDIVVMTDQPEGRLVVHHETPGAPAASNHRRTAVLVVVPAARRTV
jgi:hypothetical protein